ncbi:MAG: protein kinase [Alphaproteobacteria bacterium]|nr:protein kinase [Alphaproteobacteria bacterium]
MDLRELSPAQLPLRWGRYELSTLLGEGGLGRVYGGELIGPAGFRKPVALKVVRARPGAERLLLAEARLGARLQHPNIAQIYDLGEREGCFFLAMERVHGPDLAQLLVSRGPLPGAALLELATQIAEALVYAHALRLDGRTVEVVHRDLKPSNLLVDDRGRVCLVDFGIAVVRDPGLGGVAPLAGTPGYFAPEQARGADVDGRADLFALGVCLIEATTGHRPWAAAQAERAFEALAEPEQALRAWGLYAALDEALPGLAALVAALLHRDPARRLPSAQALRARLSELSAGDGPGLRAWMSAELQDPEPTDPGVEMTFALESAAPASTASVRVAELGPFIGREAELRAVEAALAAGERVITLEGMGGVGKTRLAREVATRLAPRFAAGVRAVDLGEARSLGEVLREVAGALELRLAGAPEDQALAVEERLAELGDLLLLIDDIEGAVHPLASLVEGWLFAAPELRLLLTGRQALGLLDEHRLTLAPLPVEDAVTLYRTLAPAQAPPEARLQALVERLDRLPLAIVLAAGRGGEGEDLLHSLLEDAGAGGGRHGTLHATLAWSWSLLEPWEQALLAQLSVFEGSFTPDAVGDVVDLSLWIEAPWPVLGLEALLEKHVVATAPEPEGPPRFFLPHSVHHFAAARLRDPDALKCPDGRPFSKSPVAAGLRARHAGWAARLGATEHRRSSNQGWTHQHMALEQSNLRVALEWALAERAEAELVGCANGLRIVYSHLGPLDEGMALVRRALDVPNLSEAARLDLHFSHARLVALTGRRMEAVNEALEAAETLRGASSVTGRALQFAAYLLCPIEPERAEVLARRSLEVLSPAEREESGQWSMHVLGVIALNRGDVDYAHGLLHDTVSAARKASDFRCEAASLTVLGDLQQFALGDPRQAARTHGLCLRLSTRMRDAMGQAVGCANLTQAWIFAGELRRAEQALPEAARLATETGMRHIEVLMRVYEAALLRGQGRHDEAERILREVLREADEASLLEAAAASRMWLMELLWQQGRAEEACALVPGVVTNAGGRVHRVAAAALIAAGELAQAQVQLALSAEVLAGTRSAAGFAEQLALEAWQLGLRGDAAEARERLAEARARLVEVRLTPQAPTVAFLEAVARALP